MKLAKMGLGMKEIVFNSDGNADHMHDTLLACCTKINTVNLRYYHFYNFFVVHGRKFSLIYIIIISQLG